MRIYTAIFLSLVFSNPQILAEESSDIDPELDKAISELLELLGGSSEYLKKENPNELAIKVQLNGDCVDEEELEKNIKGVVTRSRIKPTDNWVYDPLFLNISLDCIYTRANPVYSFGVQFGRWSPAPSIFYVDDYGTTGIGSKENILNSAKNSVERAITKYIEVNFIE